MDWLGFAGSILGGIIGGLFTYLGVKLTINHDNKKKQQEELKKAIYERPRLEVVDFKEVGKHRSLKSDFDVICLNIQSVNKAANRLEFNYDEKALDKNNLVSCEYVLKNTGLTEIDSICFISNLPKDMSIIELRNADFFINEKLLNYDAWADKRFIKPGDEVKVRIYYIKEHVIAPALSAPIGVYIQDVNGRYWHQPLFAPTKETDNTRLSSRKEMKEYSDVDTALECFEGKKYW